MSEQMREDFEAWYLAEYFEGDKDCGLEWLSTEPCGNYRYERPSTQWKIWQASRESMQSHAGYTALDMTTAAAQGFRDGAEKLKEAYRAGWDASGEGWNAEHPSDAHEKPQWEVRRDKALEEIMQQVMP